MHKNRTLHYNFLCQYNDNTTADRNQFARASESAYIKNETESKHKCTIRYSL